jgi:hypothetical protein
MVSIENKDFKESKIKYTHHEIHPSFMLGVMGNQITYPENNQLPRDLFSCGQSKQAVSMYHSNFNNRIDKFGVILNYGQIPLVKSRYMKYINNEEHPYGENTIIAIMCYNGYNVEDAVLINKGAVDRGLFRTTYFNSYESMEQGKDVSNLSNGSKFSNILDLENIKGLKTEFNYSYLDEHGLIKENTELNDSIALIGKVTHDTDDPSISIDQSTYPKKGQKGFVDKSFMTDGDEGFRIAKVRVREERIPAIGDKVCSRCGQKGTIGLIVAEEDMPFTVNGMKPDIIINPHAIPSRMTIGQLVESLVGKACGHYGSFGDCTAFVNDGPKHEVFGKLLVNCGFHSSGEEVFYNGMTGEQIETNVFVGPTYYMRLKHMVKDKINYRAKGPRTALTRQTVQGRANDGGLRIGEMERDCILSHGASNFLQESMLVRGDLYYMAVCNKTGMPAIYNENKNLFLSPAVDGPINFTNVTRYTANIDHVTRFGREFSIIKIPYSFKLLMQELGTMNIQMRIITENNIDQIENMAYSDNLNKILMENKTGEIVNDNQLLNNIGTLNNRNKTKINKVNNQVPDIAMKTPDDELEIDYTKIPDMSEMHTLNVEYKKGDVVKFNKDTKPTRMWKVGFIQDDDNIALITEDVDDIPENIEILEKKDNRVVVHATKKDIYFDLSPGYITGSPPYAPNSPLYSPNSPAYAPYAQNSIPAWDPDSPPYSAMLGRQMTKEEYDAVYNKPMVQSTAPPVWDPDSPPYSAILGRQMTKEEYDAAYNKNNIPRSPSTPPYAPMTPSVSPPSSGVSINEDYTPGTPIMITPMVPTQKLSDSRTSTSEEPISEKKGVTYSTILENNDNQFKQETPLLTTIEDEQKTKEKEEKLKSVNL